MSKHGVKIILLILSISFSIDQKECLTTGGGKTDKVCIFPFKYKGDTHRACIWEAGESEPWCSTKVKKDQTHVGNQGQWGFCNSHCPRIPKPGVYVNSSINE